MRCRLLEAFCNTIKTLEVLYSLEDLVTRRKIMFNRYVNRGSRLSFEYTCLLSDECGYIAQDLMRFLIGDGQ